MCEHVDLEIRFILERFGTFRTIHFRENSGSGQETLCHDVAASLRRRLLAGVRVGHGGPVVQIKQFLTTILKSAPF
jgi:hypothetical protein